MDAGKTESKAGSSRQNAMEVFVELRIPHARAWSQRYSESSPMNGLLIVNKPAGMTSHDVVASVRRLTGESSVGHLGTLDPMATGVLPLLLGRFTRLAQFFQQDSKRYTGTIRFGFATDTYDADGQSVGECIEPGLTLEAVRAFASGFQGEIEQMPPPFSAKKSQGVPAYKLARQGKPVNLRPVRIEIRRFEILGYEAPDAPFAVEVSSGSYIRSIAHEMGQLAGCGAHLGSLCRVQAGEFILQQAATLDEVAAWQKEDSLADRLPHPRCVLPQMPSVTVDENTAARLKNGMACNLPDYSGAPYIKIFTDQRQLFAIGRRIAGTLTQPVAVLG
jgi:tRNA pseudouridine55 synthase